MPKMHYFSNTF